MSIEERDINHHISVFCKFSSVMLNRMMRNKYGVQPCKNCGDLDLIGNYNINVINYEKLRLAEMMDCEMQETISTDN